MIGIEAGAEVFGSPESSHGPFVRLRTGLLASATAAMLWPQRSTNANAQLRVRFGKSLFTRSSRPAGRSFL